MRSDLCHHCHHLKESFLFAPYLRFYCREGPCMTKLPVFKKGGSTMSIQGINGTAAQQYQSTQQTAQGNSQTSQGESGPKVRKGGGHHHHSKPQPTGSTQATTATSATSPATQTATAVTGVATTAPATGASTGSGSLIDLLA